MSESTDREALEMLIRTNYSTARLIAVTIISSDWLAQHDAALIARARAEGAAEERERIDAFLTTVHGLNEMNVVRGLRKVMAGEQTSFRHEVRLNVYGEWCGHEGTPSHYPPGYGKCSDCAPVEGGE